MTYPAPVLPPTRAEWEALVADRDACAADARSYQDRLARVVEGGNAIRAERDAALARVARLVGVLREARPYVAIGAGSEFSAVLLAIIDKEVA